MVETSKQVRVDNWGIYFLQRLQLFFSKTDYCDLTLQFEGNVQLKVHRLVMNACTEYFAFLEQTCPALEENTIMMPSELQADVIVPIVNFMYTGMLEYHPSVFEKLYRAAETMNIAVLTKLLEAQLNPSKNLIKPKKEISNNWAAKRTIKSASPVNNDVPSPTPVKKLPIWKRKTPSTVTSHSTPSTFANSKWASEPTEREPLFRSFDNTPKPTRFEWPDDDLPPIAPMDATFDEISLTSRPLWTKEEEQKSAPNFDEAEQENRHTPSKNNSVSQDYEDDYPPKSDSKGTATPDDITASESLLKRKTDSKIVSSPKRIKITDQEDETVICIKTNNPGELDHTKVVSEILKKFPELMKKKKNIKLKIITSKNEQPQIKVQTPAAKDKPKVQISAPVEKTQPVSTFKEPKVESQPVKEHQVQKENAVSHRTRSKADFRCVSEDGPWTCMECLGDGEAPEFVLYYLFRKHMADVHGMEFENTLCKYCGKKCNTDTFMAYHLYTKHSLMPPVNITFPKCPRCPFIAVSVEKMKQHIAIHGKDEVQCHHCKLGFYNKKNLLAHIHITGHNNQSAKTGLECPYCKKRLQSPVGLFTHVRTQHLKEANRDGITSLTERMDVDDEDSTTPEEEPVKPPPPIALESIPKPDEKEQQHNERVKILSNVKVARSEDNIVNAESVVSAIEQQVVAPEANQIAVTTAATALTNIGGSLATNLGLVDIVVLDDNQQYILQQPQGQPTNTEFILPELATNEGILQTAAAASDINSTDELVMVLTDHDYQDEQNQGQGDNSNIVVLYSHPVEGQQGQFITSQGNLLVNSQGMLEIRNGAGITTTAGQILVNTANNTTTTQATPSPIESIEMIRKEIEETTANAVEKKALEEKKQEISVEEAALVPQIPEPPKDPVPEQPESNGNVEVDVPDAPHIEAMEVDEIVPEDVNKEQSQEAPHDTEPDKEHNDAPVFKEPHVADMPELASCESQPETPSLDIPPDTSRVSPCPLLPPPEPVATTQSVESEKRLILNDPTEYEVMEVDGVKSNQESLPSESQTVSSGVPENLTEAVPSSTEQEKDTSLEENLSFDTSTEVANQSDEPVLSEENANQDIQNVLNENKDNAEIEAKNGVSAEEDAKEDDEECERENENNQNTEMEQNDQNESAQSNFDDFTDDSEQSSSQKTHKDLNKEILDDWDDTDSQPSQKSHDGPVQESNDLEPEQSQIANEAAENVNKLMDDWDEEDEDQCK